MEHWNKSTKRHEENARVDAFISAYADLCRAHGLCLSHEDGHGAFEVSKVNDYDLAWVACAHIDTDDVDR